MACVNFYYMWVPGCGIVILMRSGGILVEMDLHGGDEEEVEANLGLERLNYCSV